MAHGPELNLAIRQKRFPGARAALLSDFNLQISSGSVTALLGPSGIGKSTLLRLAAGIDSDFDGSVLVDHVSATAAPRPGFVFQDPRLLPWLTAIDNIKLATPSLRTDEIQALLAKVGLKGWGDAFPSQLSGGMQRRVALARALATNAKLLFLDEPFVSLDPNLVTEMRALLAQIFDTDRPTTLLVTHAPEDAVTLADRVVVLGGSPARIELDLALTTPRAQRSRAILDAYWQALGHHGANQIPAPSSEKP